MISITDTASYVARIVSNGPSTTFNKGVGFFLRLASHTVFVSNRHVIHPFDTLTIEMPLIGKITLSSEDYKCIPHKEFDVDLAVVVVDQLEKDNPDFWSRIEHSILSESSIVSRNDVETLPVLQEIAAITMLHDLKFDGIFVPVVRKGIIASPISITKDLILSDLLCVSGNSGSPVFLLPYNGTSPRLLAVVRQKIEDKGSNISLSLCQCAYGLIDFCRWL